MYQVSGIQDKIVYFKNVLTNPNDLIKFIEDLNSNDDIYNIIPKWEQWKASNAEQTIYGYRKLINPNLKKFLKDDFISKRSRYIINSFMEAIEHCMSEYNKAYALGMDIDYSRSFWINKYNTGAKMGPHIDSYLDDKSVNKYTMVIYLNDDYEGGEIEFPNYNLKFKPESGSLVIFPSVEPYTHIAHEIISGNKYMVTSFMESL